VNKIVLILLLITLSPSSINASELASENHIEQGSDYARSNNWGQAIDEFALAIKYAPNNAKAHYYLGLSYYNKYREEIDKNINKDLMNLFQSQKSKSEPIDGENNYTKELLTKAVYGWKKSVELDDSLWKSHYYLGTHYSNSGNFTNAEHELKKAIKYHPEYINSYSVLASVYEKLGKKDLAIQFHQKSISLSPDDSDSSHYDLALIYKSIGEDKKALGEYSYLIKKKSVLAESLLRQLK
jgi:tetratricopeptide (TPR) repeat protein